MIANANVKFAWTPSPEQLAAANVTRLAHALGCNGYADAPPRLGRGARPLLARRRRRPRARPRPAVGARPRRLARDRVDDLVRGRPAQRRPGLRAHVGGAHARRDRGCLPHRGRAPGRVDVRGALRADDAARRGARGTRCRSGRPRRDLHADGARGRNRLACVRAHRRRAGADLLRLRGARRRPAAAGLRSEGRDHRRLLAPPRRPRADARDDRARRCASRRASSTSSSGRASDRTWSVELGPGELPPLEVEAEHPVPARLHLRDDRPAEGGAARPRRLPALDRPRSGLPGRHPRRRPRPLRDGHGLDHGAVDRRRRGRARRGGDLHGGRAGPTRRPALAAGRGGAGDDARRLADADPGAAPEGRARRPTSPRCARSRRPASPGTPGRTTG